MMVRGGHWVEAGARMVELERRSRRLHEAVTSETLLRVTEQMRALIISETLDRETARARVHNLENQPLGRLPGTPPGPRLRGGGRSAL